MNQTIMFPTAFHEQHQATQSIINSNIGNVINYNVFPPADNGFPDGGFQNFSITVSNIVAGKQAVTNERSSARSQSRLTNTSNATMSQDLANFVISALHSDNVPGSITSSNSSCAQYADIASQPAFTNSNSLNQCPRAPLTQLRLPNIKTSANVASNVMSEECDLGYYSFQESTVIPDFTDMQPFADGSEDTFDDAKSNFSDIIDEVLDAVNCSTISVDTSPLNLNESQENTLSDKPEAEFMQHTKYNPETFAEPVFSNGYINGQVLSATAGYIPWIQNTYSASAPVGHIQYPKIGLKSRVQAPQCELCGKCFQSRSSLRVHMRQHKERSHSCPHCEKSFAQKSTLRTHVRTHTGERPYSCSFCSRAFSDYSTYRKHVRIHTGERPYTCDVCSKSFTQSGNMLRHREVHFRKK